MHHGDSIKPELFGDFEFCKDHRVRYPYVAGAMSHAIASTHMVCKMGQARLLSFFGTGGLALEQIETAIQQIQSKLHETAPWGVNLLCNLDHPQLEQATVELFLRYKVRQVEASAFTKITPSLVLYRLRGLAPKLNGAPLIRNRVMAKISNPQVARQFLQNPPKKIVKRLLDEGLISTQEARLAAMIPMADDICVESDSGGHTDKGVAYSLVPAMLRLRDDMCREMNYRKRIRIGAGGGLGTPQAIAAAFMLGADFVLTGSINQATVEAGTSEVVKDMLQHAGPRDTAMAPAGDMFEFGAQVQVFNKGVFFPSRANKLYEIYRNCACLNAIDERTRIQIQDRFFHRSFEEVYMQVRKYFAVKNPSELEKMERNPKVKMAKVFRWYFAYSNRIAIEGVEEDRVNFQISCGPALGSFNSWVAGTALEDWHNRHVDDIADLLMKSAADEMSHRITTILSRRYDR